MTWGVRLAHHALDLIFMTAVSPVQDGIPVRRKIFHNRYIRKLRPGHFLAHSSLALIHICVTYPQWQVSQTSSDW